MFLSKVILIVNSPHLQFRPTHVTCKKQINIHYLIFYFLPYCYMQICFCKNIFRVSVNFGIPWFFDKLCYDCCHFTTNVPQKNMTLFNNMIHLPDAISCWFTDCTCRDSLYLQKWQYLHDSYEFFETCCWCWFVTVFTKKSLRLFETELNISKFIYQNKEFTDVLYFPDVVVFFIDWQVLCPIC